MEKDFLGENKEGNEKFLLDQFDSIKKVVGLISADIEEVNSMKERFYVGNEDYPGYDKSNEFLLEDLYKILEENENDINKDEILVLLDKYKQNTEDTKKDRESLKVPGEEIKNLKEINRETPPHEIDAMADTIHIETYKILDAVEIEKNEFEKNKKVFNFISQELSLIIDAGEKKEVSDISETLAGKIKKRIDQYSDELVAQENRLNSLTSVQEELSDTIVNRVTKIKNSISLISQLLSQETKA